jgi:hypothetical protein
MGMVYFLLGALSVFVALLLCGFVGCSFSAEGSGFTPPELADEPDCQEDYAAKISETSDLVAYWRLGEPDSTPIPSDDTVKDEVGGFDGHYRKLDPAEEDTQGHSPATGGNITLGVTPGLLHNLQDAPCIEVDGGFVRVPFDIDLNPSSFSLEAWVDPKNDLDPDFYYCLVESTGPTGLDQGKRRGWGLYLGPDDPDDPPDDASKLRWQVWMADNDQFKKVATAKPNFPKDGEGEVISPLDLTYLVLTYNGTDKLRLWLYYPGKNQDISHDNLQALEIPEDFSFVRNDADDELGQGAFFIGTGSNLFPDPDVEPPSQRLYPFKGKIQEVALYKKDLSEPDDDDIGVQTTLLGHFCSGGEF